jgi:C4-dicarboxylate-specific signal transduction histidine kinase
MNINNKSKDADNAQILAATGMRFFGRMSASATHEIKNTLAIINENAGLLEDLTLMAEKGHPLATERIKDISQRVARQVQRADLILKKLNRLSHSVDLTREMIDLEKAVIFVLDLAGRILEMQGVMVEIISPLSPMVVDTNLFYLQNAIWLAIDMACCCVAKEKQVRISFGTDSTIPSVWFSMGRANKDKIEYNIKDLFESKENQALMAYLGITIEKNNKNNGFGLLWTKGC